MPTKKATSTPIKEIDIIDLHQGRAAVYIVGTAPLFCNRMAEKAKRDLLLPAPAMTKSQRSTKLKHAPLREYRDSPYLHRQSMQQAPWQANWEGQDVPPTLLRMVSTAPKKMLGTAALYMPGVAKTQINCLVSVLGEYVPLWGIPRLNMSVVRMAGISRAPDIRTRARLDRWAMRIPFNWLEPMLNEKKIQQLVLAAGLMAGLGDWRQEKGGGSFGLFRLAHQENDEELHEIIETGGFLQQLDALKNPICSDGETEDLYTWYLEELERRGVSVEDETPEDIEVAPEEAEDPEIAKFGADEEVLTAPRTKTRRLPKQTIPTRNGAEIS